jgi:hypothetical protein
MPAADVTRPSEAFHALMQRLQKMHCAVARREMRVAERGRHLPLNYALARFSDHPAKRINELWPTSRSSRSLRSVIEHQIITPKVFAEYVILRYVFLPNIFGAEDSPS